MNDFIATVNEFFSQGWDGPAYIVRSYSYYDVDTSENVTSYQRIDARVITFDYVSKTDDKNNLVRTGDKQLYLKPSVMFDGIDPTVDMIEIAGKLFKIITIREFNPTSSEVIYYELFVRA